MAGWRNGGLATVNVNGGNMNGGLAMGSLLYLFIKEMFYEEVKRVTKSEKGRDGKGCEWSNIAGWC